MEMKPEVKSQMTAGELRKLLQILPDDTVLTVDLSMFIRNREGGSNGTKT